MSDWRQWREDEAYERIGYCKAHKIKPLINKDDIQIYPMKERNSFAVHLNSKGLSKREWEKLQSLLDETKGIVDVDEYGNLYTKHYTKLKDSAFCFSHRIELDRRKGVQYKVDEYYFVLDGSDMGYRIGTGRLDSEGNLEIHETPHAWRSCKISFNVNRQIKPISLGELYDAICTLGHDCP